MSPEIKKLLKLGMLIVVILILAVAVEHLVNLFDDITFVKDFVANILAGLIIAIGIGIWITNIIRERESEDRKRELLGLIRSEIEENISNIKLVMSFWNEDDFDEYYVLELKTEIWDYMVNNGQLKWLSNNLKLFIGLSKLFHKTKTILRYEEYYLSVLFRPTTTKKNELLGNLMVALLKRSKQYIEEGEAILNEREMLNAIINLER